MMKKTTRLIFFTVSVSFSLLMQSCTPGSCFEETTAFVKAGLFLDTTKKLSAPDSLTMFGAGRDTSRIYSKSRNITTALIPLDASAENCSLVLRINGISDTISFFYTSSLHMLSKECGYTYYHQIEIPVYTTNIIDTITITKSSITTRSEENIRIYY